jgi:hypothetical protein
MVILSLHLWIYPAFSPTFQFAVTSSPVAQIPSPEAEVELFASGVASVPAAQPVGSPPVTIVTQPTMPAQAGIPLSMATL